MKRTISIMAICAVVLAMAIAPVVAKKPDGKKANAKLGFKLDDHSVASGEDVTGTVKLTSTKGKDKAPIVGAVLKVLLDGADHSTVTTDADGEATVTLSGVADGSHVVKVQWDGGDTYKKAQRAQGFTVGEADDEEPEPDPSPSV